MKNTVTAITQLLGQPETAGLGRELEAEHQRLRWWTILLGGVVLPGGLLAVAFVAGVIYFARHGGTISDGINHMLVMTLLLLPANLVAFHVLPGAAVVVGTIVTFFQVRRLYVRYRLCKFLDARADLSPYVATARQTITVTPTEVLFLSLVIVVPVGLVVSGLAWAAFIWLMTGGSLAAFAPDPNPSSKSL